MLPGWPRQATPAYHYGMKDAQAAPLMGAWQLGRVQRRLKRTAGMPLRIGNPVLN